LNGLEWDDGRLAAIGANDVFLRVGLQTALGAFGSTRQASLGIVYKMLFAKESLFIGAEYEFGSAQSAGQSAVIKFHQ
jgi:hypothetical protein